MPKQLIAVRLSAETIRQLDALCAHRGDTKTGVLSLAVDRLHRDTFPPLRPEPPDDIVPASDGPPDA